MFSFVVFYLIVFFLLLFFSFKIYSFTSSDVVFIITITNIFIDM